MRIWNLANGKLLRQFGGPGDVPPGKKIGADGTLVYAPNGSAIATTYATISIPSDPGWVRLWDPATGKEIRKIPSQGAVNPRSVTFSPDSKTIAFCSIGAANAVGGSARVVTLIEVATGKEIRKITENYPSSTNLLFSNDGTKLLVSGSSDSVQELEIATGKLLRTLGVMQEYSVRVFYASMALSPDGNTVVLASECAVRRCLSTCPRASLLAAHTATPCRCWRFGLAAKARVY